MSLNNQIFSLRQAIIKAKRKAMQQSSSSSDEDYQSDSEQSVDKRTQTKKYLQEAYVNKKAAMHLVKQSQANDEEVNSIATKFYTSRKQNPSNSKKMTSQKKQIQEDRIMQSYNRSPLTYSRTNGKINGEESRISNFSINLQLSRKSNIQLKLQELRKLTPVDRNLKPGSSANNLRTNLTTFRNSIQLVENQDIRSFQLNLQQDNNLQYQHYPDYFITAQQVCLPSLFQSINKQKKKGRKNNAEVKGQNKLKQLIEDWKQIKYNLRQRQSIIRVNYKKNQKMFINC